MKYILFILITNNILFSQIYGFEEPYKKQIQLGKIDKSETEFNNAKTKAEGKDVDYWLNELNK